MRKKRKADFDKAWKEILGLHFEDFISFFFPQAHAQIAWEKGIQFLDKELLQIARSAKISTRFADKLVRVKMKVASLAILGDTNSKWRPFEFNSELLNCRLSLKFPTVKLADYKRREEVLEKDNNPFAIVVLTHLAAKTTSNNPDKRFADMFAIAKRMYAKGHDQDKVDSLLKFLDLVTVLPDELEVELRDKIHKYREGLKVQHLSNWERLAKAEGIAEGLEQGQEEMRKPLLNSLKLNLEFKFGKQGREFLPIIAKLKSPRELDTFQNRLKTVQTPAELKKFYK